MPTFAEQIAAAKRLPNKELTRHAVIAAMEGTEANPKKRCKECFCCAAEQVLAARQIAGRDIYFYTVRQRGALGIATEIVAAEDVDDLYAQRPDVELMGAYLSRDEATKGLINAKLSSSQFVDRAGRG